MPVELDPASLILLQRATAKVARFASLQEGFCCSLAAHDGGVDALARQGVDVPSSIANDEQVVVVGGGEALATQAQGCCLHALELGVGAQSLADKGVLGDCVVVQAVQVALL